MIDLGALPTSPGCYLFSDDKNRVIYVGKAKNIRKRASSYFKKNNHDPKTKSLIQKIDSVDFIATDNEVEALILENTLIKRYQPKYNINLKDAKTYAFIRLTDEKFPRLLIARKKSGRGTFYGPFVSGHERDYILWFLRKTFMIRTCKRLPKKPCLRHHIGLCNAPCAGLITQEEYNGKIEKVKMALSGNAKELIREMEIEMKRSSDEQKYEKALELRDQLEAIKRLSERQNVQRQKRYDEDIMNYRVEGEKVYLMLFNIYKGTLESKNEYVFDYNDDFLEEFMVQYYSDHEIPSEVIIPQDVSVSVKLFLEEKIGRKVKITVPKRGEKRELMDLVDKNIEMSFFSGSTKASELGRRLRLQETPSVIECFDISHLSGTSTAGSMVQFRNGRPDKDNYRRFKIKTVDGIDDFAAIAEVVKRRYTRLKREDAELPNLVIIDGGRGQLNSALREVEGLGLKIPVISIAKEDEEIYLPDTPTPLRLSRDDTALKFVREIRDEAHRFALKYNRQLRGKEMVR
ncbi:MAG: excinuclease ABC subunit UvrC [Halobacteriota archaeon]|nr:excinuclease ABC subunit UvrC [Halobacteriota archaeon]